MNKIELNVKDHSVATFLKDNAVSKDGREIHMRGCDGESAYHLLKDKLYMKASNFTVGSIVNIELQDRHQGTGRLMIHKYRYSVNLYDIISVLFILEDFKVDIIDETKL